VPNSENRRTIKYQNIVTNSMVSIIIIPILIVSIIGLSGYLVYRFLIYDLYCKRSVNRSLRKYNIKKTPSEIIKEYYANKGEQISHKEIQNLEKNYRQNEPDQFLAMYDAIRDNQKYGE
jgi:nitrate reductase NapE component